MCDQCDPFYLPVGVGANAAWDGQVERLRTAERDDVLQVVAGTLPAAGERPPGCVRITAACTACNQLFVLERGGCGPFGDQWRPLYGN
jgi:hypothetical protein